jgi:hypothetical protein
MISKLLGAIDEWWHKSKTIKIKAKILDYPNFEGSILHITIKVASKRMFIINPMKLSSEITDKELLDILKNVFNGWVMKEEPNI